MFSNFSLFLLLSVTFIFSADVHAQAASQQITAQQRCLLDRIKNVSAQATVTEIIAWCKDNQANTSTSDDTNQAAGTPQPGVVTKRLQSEQSTQFDPYILTPHRRNYMLPMLTTNNINRIQYADISGYQQSLEDYEAKFQVSFKVPFNKGSLLFKNDQLSFAFTVESWWQVYSDDISKPFRETNYMPEIFYSTPTDWHPFNTNTGVVIGAEHLSNGRSQPLSRSWNRIYAQFLVEKGPFVFSVKPWFRIPEDAKTDPLDSSGDDNPNIDDYVGNYQFSTAYRSGDFEYIFRLNHAIETGRGSAEINWTFPLWGKFIGYTTLFTGYGDSLIDYNHKQTRFGLGIALNNVL
ncbi:MAG: phospholipase A [Pseudomonadota bacterium]